MLKDEEVQVMWEAFREDGTLEAENAELRAKAGQK